MALRLQFGLSLFSAALRVGLQARWEARSSGPLFVVRGEANVAELRR
jgi:hypothetical protein